MKTKHLISYRNIIVCVMNLAFLLVLIGCENMTDSKINTSMEPLSETSMTNQNQNSQTRIDVCHVDEQGTYRKITIAQAALEAHLAHGDGVIGEGIPGNPGYIFNEDCEPVPDEIAPVEIVLENHGSCENIGLLGPSAGQDGIWFAAILSPESYPFTMTQGEIKLVHDTSRNCDSSGTFQVRVFVVDELAPPAGNGDAPPHVAVIDFPELANPEMFRILNFSLDEPQALNTGQHVVLTVDSFRSEVDALRSCIATCPVSKGTHNHYSLNTDPKDWDWISWGSSSMWMNATGY